MNDMQRERYIDAARGFGIILMIVGHAYFLPDTAFTAIYGFHMPFFFILSGCLYNNEKWSGLGFFAYLKKKTKDYILPYFVFCFINLLINIPYEYYFGIRGRELFDSTITHILWIFYAYGANDARLPNCSPLWFLPCLFLSCIYLFFLLKIKNTYRLLVCVLSFVAIYYLNAFTIDQLPWHIDIALLGMIFMYVGYTLKNCNLNHVSNKMECIIQIIALFTVGYYCVFRNGFCDINNRKIGNFVLYFVGAVTISIAMIIISKIIFHRISFLVFLGRNTIIIMAFNMVITIYSYKVWDYIPVLKNITYNWFVCTIVNLVVCLIIIYVHNYLRRLLSLRRERL